MRPVSEAEAPCGEHRGPLGSDPRWSLLVCRSDRAAWCPCPFSDKTSFSKKHSGSPQGALTRVWDRPCRARPSGPRARSSPALCGRRGPVPSGVLAGGPAHAWRWPPWRRRARCPRRVRTSHLRRSLGVLTLELPRPAARGAPPSPRNLQDTWGDALSVPGEPQGRSCSQGRGAWGRHAASVRPEALV